MFCSEASKTVSAAIKKIAVAMENGEYDFDGTKEKQVSDTSVHVQSFLLYFQLTLWLMCCFKLLTLLIAFCF